MSGRKDVEVVRRSMVGAPPSLIGTRSPRVATPKVVKKKAESEESEESAEEQEEEETAPEERTRKKKRRKIDSSTKAKRKAERRALADRVKEMAKEEEEEEEAEEDAEEQETALPARDENYSLNRYSPLQLLLDCLLRKLIDKDPEEYFALPVTPAIAPDYFNVIKEPMDFSTMKDKVEKNAYEDVMGMRRDAELIANNALFYNQPNTVYHMAAGRLLAVIGHYFGEQYLRYCYHVLPFGKMIDMNKMGIAPLRPPTKHEENKRRTALGDHITAEQILQDVDEKVRVRLSTKVPPKLSFLSDRDGMVSLNVLGGSGSVPLVDLVGPLEEGTPGMFAPSDLKIVSHGTISYLNYGPFCSFAPQFDSTWASLNKRESDILLRTYGERALATDACTLRDMVSTSAEFLGMVDNMLDGVTEGEHRRAVKAFFGDDKAPTEISDILADIESLGNIGFDVSFLPDVKRLFGLVHEDVQRSLDRTGRAMIDLQGMQRDRLSAAPPLPLSKAASPGRAEMELGVRVAENISSNMANSAPSHFISEPAIHSAMSAEADLDFDILREFLVTQ